MRPLRGGVSEVVALVRASLDDVTSEPVSVRTSGSTGEPKDVLLSRAALVASARATHDRLGGPGRWLLALPPHYVAGLQVVVRSHLAGHAPVVLDDHPGADDALDTLLADGGRAYASLVPTQLSRWLDDPRTADRLARLDAVLIGGSALRGDVAVRAREAGVRIVTTYGMSETCGGCVYDGLPLDGVAVKTGADGRVQIAGPVLFDGYDGAPDLTAEVLVDGWFTTPDLGELDHDGHLRITGRADDVVVSGGVNVPLPAVQEVVLQTPGVTDALVVGVADDDWGTRVAAVVVGDATREQVREAVAERHPRSWAPQQVLHVEAVPMLSTGKPDRVTARRLLEVNHG